MGESEDEGVAFRSNALNVVGSWLLGDHEESFKEKEQEKLEQLEQQIQRRPVTLYRSSGAYGKSLLSLTRPNAASAGAALTEQEMTIKRKILRKSCTGRIEEAVRVEQLQREEAQDEEELELVRLKTQTSTGSRKRQRTTQEKLLIKLREEAAKKKTKNLKRKLQLQRKKQQQQNGRCIKLLL